MHADGTSEWPAGVEVTIQLTADGTAVSGKTATLSAAQTSYKFEDLPKYQADGTTEIAYSVAEVDVPGYSSAVGALTNGKVTITNTHETVKISGEKTWDLKGYNESLKPASITVYIKDGENIVDTLTVTAGADNKWSFESKALPKYRADGMTEIEYTVDEAAVAGFDKVVTGTNIKNTLITTDITIRKVWNDNNNQDGVRPASVTVVLTANGLGVPGAVNVTLNAANNWTATFKDLPVYENGAPINYVWIESVPTGYTANITRTETQGEWIYTLTNSRTPETTSRTIRKVWNDQNNVDGIRPAELTVVLTGSNQYTNTLQLNAGNNWTQTVENLPVFDNGTRITYTWTEWATAGYVLTDSTTDGTTTTFTNTHEVDSRTLTVVKVWDDADNADGLRPATLNVNLQANGVTVRTVTLSEANGWRQTVTDLPMRDANGLINYSWVEPNVPGYTLSGTEENAGVTTITNRHEIDRTARTVSKRWNHGRNLQALWPTAVHVQLYAGNVLTGEVTLTAANGWTATLDDLPMREGGEEIVYRWVEHSVPMYTLTDTAITGDTTVFTNTYRDREDPPGDVPVPGPPLFEIDDFDTPLGVEVILNHVGDCYD